MNFFKSPFPTKRSTKNPRKIRGGAKFGAKSGTKIQKLGELSFCNFSDLTNSDLFSRRFREGILPNFVERSILKLTLSRLSAVPFTLQNRALSEGEKRAKRSCEKGRKKDGQQRGEKEEDA